jgi:hypothetical protein
VVFGPEEERTGGWRDKCGTSPPPQVAPPYPEAQGTEGGKRDTRKGKVEQEVGSGQRPQLLCTGQWSTSSSLLGVPCTKAHLVIQAIPVGMAPRALERGPWPCPRKQQRYSKRCTEVWCVGRSRGQQVTLGNALGS